MIGYHPNATPARGERTGCSRLNWNGQRGRQSEMRWCICDPCEMDTIAWSRVLLKDPAGGGGALFGALASPGQSAPPPASDHFPSVKKRN